MAERRAVWEVHVSGLFPNSKYPNNRINKGFTVICESLGRAVAMVEDYCDGEHATEVQVHQAMRRGYTDHVLFDDGNWG